MIYVIPLTIFGCPITSRWVKTGYRISGNGHKKGENRDLAFDKRAAWTRTFFVRELREEADISSHAGLPDV